MIKRQRFACMHGRALVRASVTAIELYTHNSGDVERKTLVAQSFVYFYSLLLGSGVGLYSTLGSEAAFV